VKYFCRKRPILIRRIPIIVENSIASPRTKCKIISERKGVIKTKLATLETVVEIFKADCHNTKLIPISKQPT
jgi:hypothetical protein